jgi:hypothetical protein
MITETARDIPDGLTATAADELSKAAAERPNKVERLIRVHAKGGLFRIVKGRTTRRG